MPDEAAGIPSRQSVADLVRGLRSPYVGAREKAQGALRDLGPAGIEGLLALMAAEEAKRRLRRRIYFGLVSAFALLGGPATAYCIYMVVTGTPQQAGMYGGAIGGIVGGGGGGMLGGFAWLLMPTAMQMQVAEVLTNLDDLRAVGPLADALGAQGITPDTRVQVGRALARLLPQIRPEHAGLLDAAQRRSLAGLLQGVHLNLETDLVVAALLALEQVGDARDVTAVEGLARSAPITRGERRCVEAADRCLAALRGRAEQARLSASLVRPAAETPDVPLLRPAGAPGPGDTALVRPARPEA